MKKIIVANWKMNGSPEMVKLWAEKLRSLLPPTTSHQPPTTVLCPPAPLLAYAQAALAGTPITIGGQDCHEKPSGAHTGDTSAVLLKELACGYVIVGHSERRQNHGESSELVSQKAAAAISAGLIPIICIGETEAERDSGQTIEVLRQQIAESIPQTAKTGNFILAYEPVWAIGSGKVPTMGEIATAHQAIISATAQRTGLAPEAVCVLYGGSVKPENAGEIMKIAGVAGVLVGGASLDAEGFWKIVASV